MARPLLRPGAGPSSRRRLIFQVASLVAPGMLAEIEIQAAWPHSAAKVATKAKK
jgi:hypothetical protein